MMTESLSQAYSNSPRRQKLQIIGSVFMAIVIAAVMLILYLVVSARVVSIGRQLQQAKDQIDQLVYQSVNYSNQIAHLSRFEVMEKKAEDLGFRAPYPGEVFYVPVPGYHSSPETQVEIQQDTRPAVINVNLLEYHQSLIGWAGQQLKNLLRPFEGL
jgi:cell division protein FtsL